MPALPDPITIGLCHGRGKLLVHAGPPLRVDLSEFLFEAVPYGMSWLNRFGGQIGMYSDAQHCVLLSRIVGPHPGHRCAALLHDSPEGMGAGDTNTFLKRALGANRLSEYEDAVNEAIWAWAGLPDTFAKYMTLVHPLDKAIGTEEARQAGLTVPPGAPELSDTAKKHVDLRFRWEPRVAQKVWEAEWNLAVAEWKG